MINDSNLEATITIYNKIEKITKINIFDKNNNIKYFEIISHFNRWDTHLPIGYHILY